MLELCLCQMWPSAGAQSLSLEWRWHGRKPSGSSNSRIERAPERGLPVQEYRGRPQLQRGKRESKERNSSSQGASWSRDPAANAAGHCFPLGWGLSPIRHVLTPPTRPAASREGAGPEQPAPQWNRGCVPEDCTPPRPTQPPVLSGRMCSLHHLHPHQARLRLHSLMSALLSHHPD